MDARDDRGWANAREAWERLAWARTHDPRFRTAKEFAEAIGEEPSTYRAYERPPGTSKHIKLSYDKAVPWARKLRVRWEWLLNGQGFPWAEDEAPEPLPEAAEAAEIINAEPDETERRRMVDMLRLMKRTGTNG